VRTSRLVWAEDFARRAHGAIDHRRKYTGEPYILHPQAVVELVKSVPHSWQMLAAAWLHDTVEDCGVSLLDIRRHAGSLVYEYVYWLTDTNVLENRTKRKALDRERMARAPGAAQTIKLADLIDNTISIVEHDPKFARVYLREKEALLQVLGKGDPMLWKTAQASLRAGFAQLNMA